MYTVSKGPSKIVAKTRRGATNYENFETIKQSTKKEDLNTPEINNIPRPVFHTTKRVTVPSKLIEEDVITPQHEEIIRYINDSWNILVAQNPYDTGTGTAKNGLKLSKDANNNNANGCSQSAGAGTCTLPASTASASTTSPLTNGMHTPAAASTACYIVEPPSPVLSDFKPFDLESWWGRRLFHNITKSL